MRFFDFCAGIGAGRLGLEKSGMTGVGYSEINKSAIKTYGIMHDASDEINYGNLTKLSPESLPEFDVLIAGFPCQTFYVIGKGAGFKDERGQIIFHLRDILSDRKTPYFILENVKGLTTHDSGKSIARIVKSLEDIGYYIDYKVLSSLSFGVPQMRQRVYFVGIRKDLVKSRIKFEWPNPTKTVTLSDVLIDCDNEITETNLKYLKEYLVNKTNQSKIALMKF